MHALQAPDEQAVAPLPGLLVVEHGLGQPRRRAAESSEVPERHGFEDVGAEEVARQRLERWLFRLLRHGVQGKRTLGCASALVPRRLALRQRRILIDVTHGHRLSCCDAFSRGLYVFRTRAWPFEGGVSRCAAS